MNSLKLLVGGSFPLGGEGGKPKKKILKIFEIF